MEQQPLKLIEHSAARGYGIQRFERMK